MSQGFTASGGSRWNHGSNAAIDNLSPFSFFAWVYPTSLVDQLKIFSKGTKVFELNGTGGDIRTIVTRATTNTDYISNTTPLATLNKWYFVATTYNSGGAAGQIVNTYVGDLTTAAAEVTYGTATDGSGADSSDASNNFVTGNKNAASFNLGWGGNIQMIAYFSGELSLATLQSYQRWPWKAKVDSDIELLVPGVNSAADHFQWKSGGGGAAGVTSVTSKLNPLLITPAHLVTTGVFF